MDIDEEMQETFADSQSDIWSDDYSDSERKLIHSDDDDEDELFTYNRAGKVVFYEYGDELDYSDCDDTDSSDTDFHETDDEWTENDIDLPAQSFEGTPGLKISPADEKIDSIVKLFIGDDFFELLCNQSNLYYKQNEELFKNSAEMAGFTDISLRDMQKFMGLLLMMGALKKMYLVEYWSNDPLIETPYFRESMSEKRFFQIWRVWHFNDNRLNQNQQNRRHKVEPVLTYFLNKFNSVYKPKQNLTIKEGFLPWKGTVYARAECSRRDLSQYGIPVKILSESDTGYIVNVEICWNETENTEKAIMAVVEPCLGVWHHVYQNTYYNSARIAENLLQKKTKTCGKIIRKRALPENFRKRANSLKRRETMFIRKQNVLLYAWKGDTLMYMMSTIHNSQMTKIGVDKRGRDVFFPNCAVEYNKHTRNRDNLNCYLSWGGAVRDPKKWSKKIVLFLINCALINSYNVYKIVSTKKKKMSYTKFVIKVATKLVAGKEDYKNEM